MWGFHISVVRKKFKALSIRSSINSLIAVYMPLKQYNTIQDNTSEADNLICLKSWNEWGDGNFIEPELRYGKDFLNVLREELNKYQQ